MFDLIVMSVVTAFIGFICSIFVLVKIIQSLSERLTKTNEQLMILLSTYNGNEAGARALVASTRLPLKNIPGLIKQDEKKEAEKTEEKDGVSFTTGYGL